jgi:geranylgeranyl transferase type-1 subunit beta
MKTLRQANRHAKYFMSLLKELPSPYVGLETSRLTVIYFCVVALDMMGRLEQVDGKRVANYVKSMIVSNTCDGEQVCGFIGSSFLGNCPRVSGMAATGSNENDVCGEPGCGFTMQLCSEFLEGHLAMTYSALATLYTLGESFDDLPKKAIVKQLSRLQGEDGCFLGYRKRQ